MANFLGSFLAVWYIPDKLLDVVGILRMVNRDRFGVLFGIEAPFRIVVICQILPAGNLVRFLVGSFPFEAWIGIGVLGSFVGTAVRLLVRVAASLDILTLGTAVVSGAVASLGTVALLLPEAASLGIVTSGVLGLLLAGAVASLGIAALVGALLGIVM